jgi:hypothetical protein
MATAESGRGAPLRAPAFDDVAVEPKYVAI